MLWKKQRAKWSQPHRWMRTRVHGLDFGLACMIIVRSRGEVSKITGFSTV